MPVCAICGLGHNEVLAGLATQFYNPDRQAWETMNRIPSRDLLDVGEALKRTLAEAQLETWPPEATCYEKHRLHNLLHEAQRRVQLKEAVREGRVTGRLVSLAEVVAAIKREDIRGLLEDLGWLPAGMGGSDVSVKPPYMSSEERPSHRSPPSIRSAPH